MSKKEDFKIDGESLVEYMGNEKNVVIPDGIKSIEEAAFLKSKVVSVVIPDGVEYIAGNAFIDSESLVKVTFPDSLTWVDNGAFEFCDELSLITTATMDHISICEGVLMFEGFPNSKIVVKVETDTMPQFFAFTAKTKGDNLSDFVREGKWDEYDSELIYNGPKYRYTYEQRILGAISRLMNPVELTKENKQLYINFLKGKNKNKILDVAKSVDCIELVEEVEKILSTSNEN